MRLTKLNMYRFGLEENEKYEENITVTFINEDYKDYLDYFTEYSCKSRKISNTRCYYVYREERKVGRKRPTEHYFFNLINIKKVIKKRNIIEFIIDRYSFEFYEGYKNGNNDYYNRFYIIDDRIDIDIKYRKFINSDIFDTLSERIFEDVENMDYEELLKYYNENKEMIEMFEKMEGDFYHFEKQESSNRPNYFKIQLSYRVIKEEIIITNDKFVPISYNYDEPNIDCGIRDWSDKTEGYM